MNPEETDSRKIHEIFPPNGRDERDAISVFAGGKPPKLRFRPGNIIQTGDNKMYEVLFAYRLVEKPHEWLFILRNDAVLTDPGISAAGELVIYDLFETDFDAHSYFLLTVEMRYNSTVRSNQRLLQAGAMVISSGAVMLDPPKPLKASDQEKPGELHDADDDGI